VAENDNDGDDKDEYEGAFVNKEFRRLVQQESVRIVRVGEDEFYGVEAPSPLLLQTSSKRF